MDLGKISVTPKGAYNSTTIYERLDIVSDNGKSYLSRIDKNNKSLTDTTAWQLLVEGGDKGEKGDTGPKGDKGEKGDTGDTGYKTIGAEPINLSSPPPTVEGWYKPTQNGTYTNYGGYTKEQGKMLLIKFTPPNIFTKDEEPLSQATKSIPQFADLSFPVTNPSVGEKIQCVDNFVPYQLLDGKTSTSANTPSTSPTIWKSMGSNYNGVTIPFSEVISFDNNLAISTKTVNSPITFSALGDYAIIGGSTLVKLTADGANVPDFSNFKKMSGSQSYVNTAGVVNNCYFFYDGIDAWLNVWQGVGTSNIIYNDVTPPTAPTLSFSNETSITVDLSWSGATDNVGVTSYEIYTDKILIDTVSASPLTVTGLTASTTYAFKVKAKDASGNESAFSNVVSVTTSAAPPTFLSVVFDELYGATYSSGLLSGNNLTGGYQSTAQTINDGFFLYMTDFAFTSVLGLANSKSSAVSYGTDSTYIYAFYRTNVGVDLVKGSGRTLMHSSTSGVPNYVKLERVGNNAVFSTSSDGISWTVLFTDTNGFSGVTTAYIKGVFANNAGTIRAFKNP